MKKAFIYNIGCKIRLLDAKLLSEYLKTNNYTMVNNPSNADVIILFTCAATDEGLECGIRDVKKLQKKYSAEVIVAGCLPSSHEKELSQVFDGKTISTKDLDKFPEKVDEVFPDNKIKFSNFSEKSYPLDKIDHLDYTGVRRIMKLFQSNDNVINKTYFGFRDLFTRNFFDNRSMASKMHSKNVPYPIRISWGCYGNCSYCAIKNAIGKFHSKPLEVIIDDFKKGLDEGLTNMFLTADSTGAYGVDIGFTFPGLLNELSDIPGDFEISITNLHPTWINKYIDELETVLKKQKIKILDIPLQSGSERLLKLMNRFSDIDKIEENFKRLKKAFPDVFLTTHLIAGFPTETEEELGETLNFVKKVGISSGSLLPFSCKSGSKAEEIEPKLTDKEIIQRKKYAKKTLKKLGYKVVSKDNNYNFY